MRDISNTRNNKNKLKIKKTPMEVSYLTQPGSQPNGPDLSAIF